MGGGVHQDKKHKYMTKIEILGKAVYPGVLKFYISAHLKKIWWILKWMYKKEQGRVLEEDMMNIEVNV